MHRADNRGVGLSYNVGICFEDEKDMTKTDIAKDFFFKVVIPVFLAWFLFAMYERNGQPLERHLRNVIHLRYLQHKHRTYETENLYSVCAKQAKLLREVREIAGKN